MSISMEITDQSYFFFFVLVGETEFESNNIQAYSEQLNFALS